MKVKDVMIKDPVKVSSNITLYELQKIFDSVPFWTLFVVENEKLVGVVTRNDLLKRGSKLPLDAKIYEILSKPYYKLKPNSKITQAEKMLNKYNVTSLPVIDKNNKLIGVIGLKEINSFKKIKECSHYNCKKQAIQKCVYCNQYFCEKHIEPYEPEFGRDFDKKKDTIAEGHPCLEFVKERKYQKLAEDIVRNAKTQYFIGGKRDVNWWINWYLKKYDDYQKERINYYLKYYKNKVFEEIREEEERKKNYEYIMNTGFNREWIGKPISEINKKKFKYLPHIFFLLIFAIFSIAFLNSINVINLDVYGVPCGEIPSGHCLGIKPLYCNDGTIEKNTFRCGCGPNQVIFNNDCFLACSDGTIYGNCSEKNLSYICLGGVLEYAPEKCGCPENMEYDGIDCIFKTCLDGTIYGNCSSEKPLYCNNGVLINNSKECGCPENYVAENNICVKSCSDGTKYGECSKNQPYYCYEGELISLAKTCGCPKDYILDGEKCYYKYETNPKEMTFSYFGGSIDLTLYEGVSDYLSQIPREIYYYSIPPTTRDFMLKNIDNEIQNKYLMELVNKIQNKTSNQKEQALIAITLVQMIPYDYDGFYSGNLRAKYAYEVLYTNTGVCGEKSPLLAYLLRELGFGVVLFHFEKENHMAVGIKCNTNDYLGTGYCFIESTQLSPIGDSYGYYIGVGRLTSTPEIIYISDGISYEN